MAFWTRYYVPMLWKAALVHNAFSIKNFRLPRQLFNASVAENHPEAHTPLGARHTEDDMEERDYCRCNEYEGTISDLEDKVGSLENDLEEAKKEIERLKDVLNDVEIAASKA